MEYTLTINLGGKKISKKGNAPIKKMLEEGDSLIRKEKEK